MASVHGEWASMSCVFEDKVLFLPSKVFSLGGDGGRGGGYLSIKKHSLHKFWVLLVARAGSRLHIVHMQPAATTTMKPCTAPKLDTHTKDN